MNEARQWSILLVEDEPTNVILIRRAMSKVERSIHLKAVANGEQAVSYLRREGDYADPERYPLPDLVLTDIKMPRMNGMELLAWIKQQPQFLNLPVVILSSSGDPEEMERATQLGASSYIVRPGSSHELVERMRQLVTSFDSAR